MKNLTDNLVSPRACPSPASPSAPKLAPPPESPLSATRLSNIMIVDDEEYNILVVRRHLRDAGYEHFTTTTESTSALALMWDRQPDLVLLDVMMPGITGLELLQLIRGDEKLARIRDLYGVRDLINYRTLEEPFKDRVNALTGGKGADVIYDPIGGELFQQCLRAVAWEGRILVVGFAADSVNLPQARTNLLLLKGSALVGVFWGRFTRENPERSRQNFETLFRMHAEGKLAPHVSHRFPLEQGIEALQALARREVVGKCVVTID